MKAISPKVARAGLVAVLLGFAAWQAQAAPKDDRLNKLRATCAKWHNTCNVGCDKHKNTNVKDSCLKTCDSDYYTCLNRANEMDRSLIQGGSGGVSGGAVMSRD